MWGRLIAGALGSADPFPKLTHFYLAHPLNSPLVVHTSPEHQELTAIDHDCITRLHIHHYLGFAATQWNLLPKNDPPRVKPLLCVYRVLLTGIHLMRTGKVEANLVVLNDEFRLPYNGTG